MSTPPCARHQAGLPSLFSFHNFILSIREFCSVFLLFLSHYFHTLSHFSHFRLSFFHILLCSCFHSLCFLRVLWLCLILLPPCTRVPHYFHIPTFCLNLFSLSISSFCFPLYLRYTSVNHCTHDLSFCIDIVATNTTQIYGSSNFYCSSTA